MEEFEQPRFAFSQPLIIDGLLYSKGPSNISYPWRSDVQLTRNSFRTLGLINDLNIHSNCFIYELLLSSDLSSDLVVCFGHPRDQPRECNIDTSCCDNLLSRNV